MGQKRGNMETTQGRSGGALPVAPPPARTRVRNMGDGEGAETACSGARSRGAALTQLGRSQNTGGTAGRARTASAQQGVASGAAGGFIERQPVTAISNRCFKRQLLHP